MPRYTDAAIIDQLLLASAQRPAQFVKVEAGATLRIWDGSSDVTIGSETWVGFGDILKIEGIKTERAAAHSNVTITAAGIPVSTGLPNDFVPRLKALGYKGKRVTIYLGFMALDSEAILVEPVATWAGLVSNMDFQLGTPLRVTLTCENRTGLLRKTNGLRMTAASHQQRLGNPTTRDTFFDFNQRLNARATQVL